MGRTREPKLCGLLVLLSVWLALAVRWHLVLGGQLQVVTEASDFLLSNFCHLKGLAEIMWVESIFNHNRYSISIWVRR